jgi:hypothetical protein
MTVYAVTIKVENSTKTTSTTKTIFSEESYEDAWKQLLSWAKINYPSCDVIHIHSSETNYKN